MPWRMATAAVVTKHKYAPDNGSYRGRKYHQQRRHNRAKPHLRRLWEVRYEGVNRSPPKRRNEDDAHERYANGP